MLANRRPWNTGLLVFTLSCLACAPRPSDSGQDSAAVTALASDTTAAERPMACAMVTSSEMSEILGSTVVGQPNDRSTGSTECIYQPSEGVSPYVELSVDWGGGEAAMQAMGMRGQADTGITNPYAGIGDQAAAVGPSLMIRTGDDLVKIVFSGVDDAPAAARRIFSTARARM
ncbi:MAG: hypothetical protein ABIZ91_05940 [Gemmatimonadaceae bacterium]